MSFILMFNVSANENLYQFEISSTSGKTLKLEQFKDKTLLLTNIATRCGYTDQLDEFEKLYQKYQKKGLIIIGIPSNDFAGQTPEGDKDVAKFCRLKYGVSFPLTTKVKVIGKDKHPLIKWMTKQAGGDEIKWNFEKFLFNKDGKLIQRFSSATRPLSDDMLKKIEKSLSL